MLHLLACQEPFPEDRHDLATFRIAAVRAEVNAEGSMALSALVYPGGQAWHDEAPDVRWQVGDWSGEGARVSTKATFPATVEVVATAGELREEAVLVLDAAPSPPQVAGWSRGTTALTLADLAQDVATREAAAPGPDEAAPAGGGLRLDLDLVDDGERVVRWMATGGDFAELSATGTDWFAGTATVDDGEVVDPAPLTAGVYPLVALVLDGEGGNTWTWLDARVDTVGPTLFAGGRTFPVDAAPGPEGWWEATLEAEASLVGYRLVDVVPVAKPVTPPVCGGAFDPAGVAEGWCPRRDLVGARVTLWGEVRP